MERLKERNLVRKKWRPGMLRVAVLYPSHYSIAASSLSYQMLYYYLASIPQFYVERIVMREEPTSLESGLPLRAFDLAFMSIHYEPDYVNFLYILIKGGVEPRASRRNKPWIIVGGPPIISNPSPIEDFADVMVIGEIESTLPPIIGKIVEHYPDKEKFLESLDPKKGFYTGKTRHTGEKVYMNYAVPLPKEFHPKAQFSPINQVEGYTHATMVETNRGCFRMCSFCMEGHIFNYMRERPLSDVLEIIDQGVRLNDTLRLKFISLSFFDYSHAEELLEEVYLRRLEASIPSLRAETLNEYRLELMRKVSQKTLTIAPETGSRRLAIRLRKYVPPDMALSIATAAKALGFKGLKMYFMIGLPGEELEDLEADVEYILTISRSGFRGNRELKVTVSPLVPKPHTEFEREPWVGLKEARRRIHYLKRRVSGVAEIRPYDPRWAQIQTVISRGGAELGKLLLRWALEGGGLGGWRKAVKESGINIERYLGRIDGEVPWRQIVVPGRPSILRA